MWCPFSFNHHSQLVVRFDLPDRPRSLIQSRGRARVKQSRLVMFVSSQEHLKTLASYQKYANHCSDCSNKHAYDKPATMLGTMGSLGTFTHNSV